MLAMHAVPVPITGSDWPEHSEADGIKVMSQLRCTGFQKQHEQSQSERERLFPKPFKP